MKVIYLYHSGIAFELERSIVVVDYYQPEGKEAVLLPEIQRLLRSGKRVYVMASHVHADHFDPKVLSWKNLCPDIRYVFSDDIRGRVSTDDTEVVFLEKGAVYEDGCLIVKAYGSTDAGISFFIQTEGWRLFHSGDLNNWHWNEESTEEEIRESEAAFQKELSLIRSEIRSLDVLCFPVDPRLGHDYMRGAGQFLAAVPVQWMIPIHFSAGGFAALPPFQEVARKYGAHSWNIQKECDYIIIDR